MAADLKDLRAKITPRAWCFLEADSRATGKDIAELVREILALRISMWIPSLPVIV